MSFKKRLGIAACIAGIIAVAAALVAAFGWHTIGSTVNIGNSTLTDMAAGTADGAYYGYSNSKGTIGDASQGAFPEAPYEADIDWNTEEYSHTEENGYRSVAVSPLSTFAADVDTASYSNVRRMILSGQDVTPDAVRIEEMINYFRYDYPEPTGGDPFSVTTDVSYCPWNDQAKLLRIGLQAKKPDLADRAPSNFVFLIDVSGSMYSPDKLPLVKKAFLMLTEEMTERDRVSIVTYASSDQVLVQGSDGADGIEIRQAIESLEAGGGTNGSKGIQTAYKLAKKYFVKGGNNRIILATDGDLNIGVTSEGELARLVKDMKKSGVHLSVLGFGTGNIKDNKMETLADNGDGNYYYIDSELEAKRVLVEEMGGTLNTVAKDVKFQVEFNPAYVKGYRLVGYENRLMAAEDFADDTKDGGEIGEGHRVTVLYELVMADSGMDVGTPGLKYQTPATSASDEWLTVSIRYKQPDGDKSTLLEYPVGADAWTPDMPDGFRFAACVAETAMLLRKSEYIGSITYADILEDLSRTDYRDDIYKTEFVGLVRQLDNGRSRTDDPGSAVPSDGTSTDRPEFPWS